MIVAAVKPVTCAVPQETKEGEAGREFGDFMLSRGEFCDE